MTPEPRRRSRRPSGRGRVRLTERYLKSLRTKKRRDVWDDVVNGLAVRVSPTGDKTFFLRYSSAGKRRRLTLGSYPVVSLADARSRAIEALQAIDSGRDPQEERRAEREASTFAELADLYMERHAKRKKRERSWREDLRQINKDLLPAWGKWKAHEIRRRDVIALAEDVAAGAVGGRDGQPAPVAANRLLALISKIFSFAVEQEILEANPAARVPKVAQEEPRERVLGEKELEALWPALDALHPVVGAFWRLLTLTAQRPGEVKRMRWADLDGDWWTIPADFSKNRRSHRVPLSPQAQAILAGLQPLTGEAEWVLESPRKAGHHVVSVHKTNARLLEATGLDRFTPHDLRRTAATHMTSAGVSRLVVDRILNHAERGVSAVYDRSSYDVDKRQALVLWGDRLEAIVSGDDNRGRVVRIG